MCYIYLFIKVLLKVNIFVKKLKNSLICSHVCFLYPFYPYLLLVSLSFFGACSWHRCISYSYTHTQHSKPTRQLFDLTNLYFSFAFCSFSQFFSCNYVVHIMICNSMLPPSAIYATPSCTLTMNFCRERALCPTS